tara:strand:+ start:694 stop:807 length:114 start_codon:yes stop_codon:yes gene_type:complete
MKKSLALIAATLILISATAPAQAKGSKQMPPVISMSV